MSAGVSAVRGALIVLALLAVLCTATPGRVGAASGKNWNSAALHLALTYPANWKMVPEHGAAVLLRSVTGRAEFEIFRLAPSITGSALRAAADHALVVTKCHTDVKLSLANVGKLGMVGDAATGLCTGADRGWRLTIVTFRHAGNSVLARAWLFHADAAGGQDLMAIRASLAGTS